jgi:hypothetical protein
MPTWERISVSDMETSFRVRPCTLHYLYYALCQWLTFIFSISIASLIRLTMFPTKKKRKDDKWKSHPEDVAVKHPLDEKPISEGAIPPKNCQEGQEEDEYNR